MLYRHVPSGIARSTIACVAAGAVVAAAAGCASGDEKSSSTSGLVSIAPPTTVSPVIVVDANDYVTDRTSRGDNYYGFQVVSASGERITECALTPIATSPTTVAPGGHYPACSATFPPGTTPVSSPPFEGPPNAVRIEEDGIVDYIGEGFAGPVTLKELPPNSQIVIGDAECLSLLEGGVDCTKGSYGFRYTPGTLTKRVADTPEGTDGGQPGVNPSTTAAAAPPMDGPYTEGTTPAVPGTACGAATGERVVEVVSGSISCTDALAVMERYRAVPNDGSYGNANIRQFDGWSCVSPTAGSAQEQGFGSKCSKDDIVLTAPI